MLRLDATVRLLGAIALSCAVFLPEKAFAQGPTASANKILAPDGTPTLIRFTTPDPSANTAARSATDGRQVLRQYLRLGANDDMRPLRTETDPLGYRHERYQQYYRGIKVEHGQYSIHRRNGVIETLSGELKRPSARLNVRPSLTAANARQRALTAVGAQRYKWQDAGEEQALRQLTGDAAATYYPQGELVLVNDFRQGGPNAPLVLAWKFNVYASEPLSRDWIYVDAHTGRIVLRDAIIKHTVPTGTFQTRYSGGQVSATESVTGGFRLRDNTRGLGIQTYNLRTGTNYTTGIDFIDADNDWTAAEYDNTSYDNAALDAHYGAQATYDYWLNQFGRSSFDNAGSPIISYVHYNVGYDNAFWNGMVMTYGDGSRKYQPLTSLDVCAHEIGHALCQHTAGLIYENESGALNEGLSDIWGACVEYDRAPSKQTWLIGEEITKTAIALRSMSNPNQFSQPDTYQGARWIANAAAPAAGNDYGGVHINSGVLNYWFYLLSVGGAGTNDNGSSFSVNGIGIGKAAQIVYRTESYYLTSNAGFVAMRNASLQAAADLYGTSSAEIAAVANAWKAVGLNEPAPTLTSLSLTSGPVGSSITLTGANLLTTTSVVFNGVPATNYVVNSATSITVLVPVTATSGTVAVITPSGTAVSNQAFTVTSTGAAPLVRAFFPVAGQPVGGSLTIYGTGFNGTSSLTCNGLNWPFTVQNDTCLVAQVPPGASGGVLRVTSPGGIGTARSRCDVPPAIQHFSPVTGCAGTSVRVVGTSFNGVTAVRFNGLGASGYVVEGDSALLVRVPGGAGSGSIEVVTADGSGTSGGSFTVTANPAPVIQTFAPATGGPNQTVTIRGQGFWGTTGVSFGGAGAGTFWVDSDTIIRAIVPLQAVSGVVRVKTPGGTAISTGSFTITAPVCGLKVQAGPVAPVACAANNQTVMLTATVQGAAQVPTYTVEPIPFAPLSIVGRGGPAGDNRVTAELPIGFSFNFFGRDYASFYISTNGNIQFDGPGDTRTYAPALVPLTSGTGTPHNFIAVAWSNWNRAVGGSITYYTTGTAPNRKLVVSFTNVPHFNGGSSVNAQAVLYEGSNQIDLIYTNVGPMAPWALAGVENAAGTDRVVIPGRDNTYWRASSEAWRFTPASRPGPVTFAWSGPGIINPQGASATVQVSSSAYFKVIATDSLGSRTDSVWVSTDVPAPTTAGAVRCGAASVTLTAAGAPAGGAYQWYDAAGVPISGANSASFTTPLLTTSTNYFVAARNAAGCESSIRATAAVTLHALPAIPILTTSAGTLLLNQSATLTISNPGSGVTYTWTGPGLNAVTGTSVTATPTAIGTATYSVMATSAAGCVAANSGTIDLTVIMTGAPTITSFSPTSAVAGTSITLTGTNFTTASQVTFGGIAATSFTVVSPTSLTVTVPAAALSGAIGVTTIAGTGTSAGAFKVRPAIGSFTPIGGAPGEVVTVTGTGFSGATSLKFGTITTTAVTVINATTLTAVIPPLATTGKLTVTTPNGTALSAGNLTVAPLITSFMPTQGAPGSIVLVQGLNFLSGTKVRINGVTATTTYNSTSQLTAVVPSAATSGIVSVTSTVGAATESINFTVVSGLVPAISSFAPTANVIAGTTLTLTGANFTGANRVRFNNVDASGFTVNSPTQLTVKVPAGATTGRIYVATPAGMTQSTGNLTIIQPPTLTSLSNTSGAPGSVVVLGGTNLSGATTVTLNGISVPFQVNTTAQVVVTIPVGATSGHFALTTVAGTATTTASFTVTTAAAPIITSVLPLMGVRGSTVVVKGANFNDGISVRIGSVAVTSFVVNSTSQITLTVPATATSNRIYVIAGSGGAAQSASSFTVILAPSITSFTPATAPVGALVTINGNNFTGATSVSFGETPTTIFTVVSATRITVNVPPGATSGALQVTNPAGTATAASMFTVTGNRSGARAEIPTPATPLHFELHPNPAREAVWIEVSDWSAQQAIPPVELFDALNRLVYRMELINPSKTISLTGLLPGIYTVRVGSATRRLLVQ